MQQGPTHVDDHKYIEIVCSSLTIKIIVTYGILEWETNLALIIGCPFMSL